MVSQDAKKSSSLIASHLELELKGLNTLKDVQNIWVGFSGGCDSVVLLHAVCELVHRLMLPIKVHAIHVHHGLSYDADDWLTFCQIMSERFGCTFYSKKIVVTSAGRGLEDAARKARFSIFESLVEKNDILLLAHHANDQAETLLYRMMRGAGLKGLCAIPAKRHCGKGQLIRPFLSLTRASIEQYAYAHSLNYIQDESNQNERYDRNFLRHKVIPVLEQRWSHAINKIAQTAALLSDSQELLNSYLATDFALCEQKEEYFGQSIVIDALMKYRNRVKQAALLRYWFEHFCKDKKIAYNPPSQGIMRQILILLESSLDSEVEVSWGNLMIRRYGLKLYCLDKQKLQNARYASEEYMQKSLSKKTMIDFSCVDSIQKKTNLAQQILSYDKMDILSIICHEHPYGLVPGQYRVEFRAGGERCLPYSRAHSQKLKKLFQEYRLEPWLRSLVPILYHEQKIACVVGVFYCADFYVKEGLKVSALVG